MATLSKQVIEQIAKRMTERSKKFVESCLKEYQQLATDYYEQKTPEKVKETRKAYPEYFQSCGSLQIYGTGFNHEHVSATKRVISNLCSNYNGKLELTDNQAGKLIDAKRKWEKAKKDFDTLLQETESALLSLKTHKNIKENLPEAAPYLPPPMSNALVVNFDSLKRKLNKQPDAKEVVEP